MKEEHERVLLCTGVNGNNYETRVRVVIYNSRF